MKAGHHGVPVPRQFPHPHRMARHHRVAQHGEDESAACTAFRVFRTTPVTPVGSRLRPHGLTARIAIRPVSCRNRHVCKRIHRNLGLRAHLWVGLEPMFPGGLDGGLLSCADLQGLAGLSRLKTSPFVERSPTALCLMSLISYDNLHVPF